MASKFSVSASVNITDVQNLNKTVRDIKQRLSGIDAKVKLNINDRDLNRTQTALRKTQTELQRTAKDANITRDAFYNLGEETAKTIKRYGVFVAGTKIVKEFFFTLQLGVRDAIRFQDEIVKLAQVTGRSVKDMRGLADEVTRISKTFGVSSRNLLEGSQILAQAGFSIQQTQKLLETLAKVELSPTFSRDVKQNAEGLIAIFQQFKLSVNQVEDAFSAINDVSKRFAVESKDIIAATKIAGGAFAAAGGQIEDFIALFSAVRSTTRESAESIATGFRTIFTRIQRPKTLDFLKTLGIELQQDGLFKGPFKAIRELNSALKSINPQDPRFAQIVEELGGFRQVSKVIPLIQEYTKAVRARGVAESSANSITDDAIKRQQSLQVEFVKLKEEIFDLIRAVGDNSFFKFMTSQILETAKAVTRLTQTFVPLISAFSGLAAFSLFKPGANTIIERFNKGFGAGLGRPIKTGDDFLQLNTGGKVPGVGNTDSVLAKLTPGEFILRKEAVAKLGLDNVKQLNKAKGYNNGGLIGNAVAGVRRIASENKLSSGLILAGIVTNLTNSFKSLDEEAGGFAQTLNEAAKYATEFGTKFLIFSTILKNLDQKKAENVISGIGAFGRTPSEPPNIPPVKPPYTGETPESLGRARSQRRRENRQTRFRQKFSPRARSPVSDIQATGFAFATREEAPEGDTFSTFTGFPDQENTTSNSIPVMRQVAQEVAQQTAEEQTKKVSLAFTDEVKKTARDIFPPAAAGTPRTGIGAAGSIFGVRGPFLSPRETSGKETPAELTLKDLQDKKIAASGKFPGKTKDQLAKIINDFGGRYSTEVAPDFMIASEKRGGGFGAKIEKARSRGTRILTPEQFSKIAGLTEDTSQEYTPSPVKREVQSNSPVAKVEAQVVKETVKEVEAIKQATQSEKIIAQTAKNLSQAEIKAAKSFNSIVDFYTKEQDRKKLTKAQKYSLEEFEAFQAGEFVLPNEVQEQTKQIISQLSDKRLLRDDEIFRRIANFDLLSSEDRNKVLEARARLDTKDNRAKEQIKDQAYDFVQQKVFDDIIAGSRTSVLSSRTAGLLEQAKTQGINSILGTDTPSLLLELEKRGTLTNQDVGSRGSELRALNKSGLLKVDTKNNRFKLNQFGKEFIKTLNFSGTGEVVGFNPLQKIAGNQKGSEPGGFIDRLLDEEDKVEQVERQALVEREKAAKKEIELAKETQKVVQESQNKLRSKRNKTATLTGNELSAYILATSSERGLIRQSGPGVRDASQATFGGLIVAPSLGLRSQRPTQTSDVFDVPFSVQPKRIDQRTLTTQRGPGRRVFDPDIIDVPFFVRPTNKQSQGFKSLPPPQPPKFRGFSSFFPEGFFSPRNPFKGFGKGASKFFKNNIDSGALLSALLAGSSTASSFLQSRSQEKIALGTGGVTEGLLGNIFSGASTGALTGAAFGIPGIIGGGLLGSALAVYFDDTAKRLEASQFDKKVTKFAEVLDQVAKKAAEPAAKLFELSRGLDLFKNRIFSTTGADRETARAEFSQQVLNINEFFSQIAEGVSDIKDFRQIVGEDTIRTFAVLSNQSIPNIIKIYEEQIDAQKEAISREQDIARRSNEAVKRIVSIRSFSTALDKATNRVNLLSSSLTGALSQNSFIDPRNNNLQRAERFSGFIGGPTATNFVNEVQSAQKIEDVLPQVLSNVRFNPLDANEALIPRIRTDIINATGLADDDPVINNLLSGIDKIIGNTGDPTVFLKRLDNEFSNVVEQLAGDLTQLNDLFNKLESQISDAGTRYASVLDTISQQQLQLVEDQGRLIATRGARSTFGLQFNNANPNSFFNQQSLTQQQLLNNITGGQDIATLAQERVTAEQAIIDLDEQIRNTKFTEADQLQDLINARAKEKLRLEESTRALKFLSDVSNSTAAAQQELSRIENLRQNRTNFASSFTFGSSDNRFDLARGIIEAQKAVAQGDLFGFSDKQRQRIDSLLSAFAQDDRFNGLTGEQARARLIEGEFRRNGVDPELAKLVSGEGKIPAEQQLATIVNAGFQTAIDAQAALITGGNTTLSVLDQTIKDQFAENIKAIRETFQQEQTKQNAQQITSLTDELNKLNKINTELKQFGADFNTVKVQKDLTASLPEIRDQLKNLSTLDLTITQGLNDLFRPFENDRDFEKALNKVINNVTAVSGSTGVNQNDILDLFNSIDPLFLDKSINRARESQDKLISEQRKEVSRNEFSILKSLQESGISSDTIKLLKGTEEDRKQIEKLINFIGSNTNPVENQRKIDQLLEKINTLQNNTAPGFNRGGAVNSNLVSFSPKGSDRIPAMLADGEFVMKKDAVSKYGLGMMKAINAGYYADGGLASLTELDLQDKKPIELKRIEQIINGNQEGSLRERLDKAFKYAESIQDDNIRLSALETIASIKQAEKRDQRRKKEQELYDKFFQKKLDIVRGDQGVSGSRVPFNRANSYVSPSLLKNKPGPVDFVERRGAKSGALYTSIGKPGPSGPADLSKRVRTTNNGNLASRVSTLTNRQSEQDAYRNQQFERQKAAAARRREATERIIKKRREEEARRQAEIQRRKDIEDQRREAARIVRNRDTGFGTTQELFTEGTRSRASSIKSSSSSEYVNSAFYGNPQSSIVKPPSTQRIIPGQRKDGGFINKEYNEVQEKQEKSIKEFSRTSDKMTEAMNNFPREVSHTINGKVEVILNGAEVLTNIQPAMQELVERKIAEGIRNFVNDNLPELGS